jgi:tetratricopeptide (TPR) repeat protein
MRRTLVALVIVAAAGCASAPLKKPDVAALANADALVLQGCYDCMLEARDTYERIAAGKARPLVIQRLFEVTALLALRERELAMDDGPSLERAKALASELPANLAAADYLAIIDLISGHDAGWSKLRREAFDRARRGVAATVDERRKWLDGGLLSAAFRQYLSTALDCAYFTRGRPGGPRIPEVPAENAPPLRRYQLATCFAIRGAILEAVRSEVPRFVETSLFLGRLELRRVEEDGGRRARPLLQEAYARFPKSPAVTFFNGSLNQTAGDSRAALRFYDETLALEPRHEDAMLGRTVSLSYLKQHREAIAAATELLELNAPQQADGYYWRAWNHHHLTELTQARADIDRARARRFDGRVLTLAGVIEHDQNDLDPAEQDLATAAELDTTNCTARWYQALVQLKRQKWDKTAGQFVDAMTCYERLVALTEERLENMRQAENVDEEFRSRQVAGFEIALGEDRGQVSASAFNAANNYLRARDIAKAIQYADVAAKDPDRAAKVEELRKLIREIGGK